MEYGDKRLFAMLTMLFPFLDVKNQKAWGYKNSVQPHFLVQFEC